MATLTYDPTPADQPEFNEAEQEALAIGEQAAAEQNQMLAGKFKDPEALEKAYLELQSKLGEPNENESDEVREQEAPAEEEVTEAQTLLSNASAEWSEKGELSAETVAELSKLSSQDLISAYLEAQQAPSQTQDLSQGQVDSIYKAIGGEEQYNALTTWAANNLPEAAVSAYNNLVEQGDPATIQLALAGLRAAYIDSNGYEGETLTGKPAANKADVFRSQAEVVQAMSDPRYDRDPAYRNDVFEKLNRSNLDY